MVAAKALVVWLVTLVPVRRLMTVILLVKFMAINRWADWLERQVVTESLEGLMLLAFVSGNEDVGGLLGGRTYKPSIIS